MATTGTITEAHDRAMQLLTATLTFSDSGDNAASAVTTHSYYGYVVQCFIDHGGTAPTNLYDLVVTDDSGIDVLNGKGGDIASGTDTHAFTQTDLDNGMACHGQLVITGTNGGTGSGIAVVYLYIARYQ